MLTFTINSWIEQSFFLSKMHLSNYLTDFYLSYFKDFSLIWCQHVISTAGYSKVLRSSLVDSSECLHLLATRHINNSSDSDTLILTQPRDKRKVVEALGLEGWRSNVYIQWFFGQKFILSVWKILDDYISNILKGNQIVNWEGCNANRKWIFWMNIYLNWKISSCGFGNFPSS